MVKLIYLPQRKTEAAFKGVFHPFLNMCCVLHEELGSVQTHDARFVTGNYNNGNGSPTSIFGRLKWDSLKKRRHDELLMFLYKGLEGKVYLSRCMRFPTMWHFDKCRLRRACTTSF